ncbi:MAG: zinc ribbon domain-containing protein [Ignavibacteriae bacterium]|nr:zinc ribbon domain-containing protein [Ignavibacteriota bacterium]
MPTYDYKCDSCNHTFEVMQSIKDEPLTKCPNCGKNKLKKQISSGAGFILKGSGFYLTDYKNKHSKTHKVKSTTKTEEPGTKIIDTTKSESEIKTKGKDKK